MSYRPLFTLITSTLNSGATLKRCLRSVAGQVNASFEHLIADGASVDDTLAIVNHFSRHYPLHLVCSAPDAGLYQAWNRALEQARGKWILFLGSDDFLVSNGILNSVSQAIEVNTSLHHKRFLFGDTISTGMSPDWSCYQPNVWIHHLRGVTEFPSSVFINSLLFQQGHRFDESYRICADHKFFAEHDFFSNAIYLPMHIISFQQGGISSNASFERIHYMERRRMLAELKRSRPWFTEWYYWLRSHQLRPSSARVLIF